MRSIFQKTSWNIIKTSCTLSLYLFKVTKNFNVGYWFELEIYCQTRISAVGRFVSPHKIFEFESTFFRLVAIEEKRQSSSEIQDLLVVWTLSILNALRVVLHLLIVGKIFWWFSRNFPAWWHFLVIQCWNMIVSLF